MATIVTEKDVVAELLAKLSDAADQSRERGPLLQKRAELSHKYPPANREKLRGIFGKGDAFDLRQQGAFVYGPPVMDAGKPLLPIVTVNASFAAEGKSWISVYVMCWVYYRRGWSVLPIRFERPPSDHMSGAHGYNHAQFFWSLSDDDKPVIDGKEMEWLPQKQPAIPLPISANVSSIVASAIVSLYGLVGARAYFADLEAFDFPFGFTSNESSRSGEVEASGRGGQRRSRQRK